MSQARNIFLVVLLGTATAPLQGANVISVDYYKQMMYVLYTEQEAKPLKTGSQISVTDKKGKSLSGVIVNTGKWFNKIMAKIKLTAP